MAIQPIVHVFMSLLAYHALPCYEGILKKISTILILYLLIKIPFKIKIFTVNLKY